MRGPSPFTQRSPVTDPARFFGRQRELQSVLARVAEPGKPQCVSIVGMRRIGKSSLLRQLADVLAPARSTPDAPLLCVYHDLEGSSGLTVERFFRDLSRKLEKQAVRAGLAVRQDSGAADAEEAFSTRLEDLSDDDVRVVFFLDEFDAVTLNPRFDADLFGRLRYLASSLQVAYVTASFAELTDLCHQQEIRQSPFFNIFSSLHLGLLLPEDADRLVAEEAARGGGAFSAEERELITLMGGTHPFHVQQAAHATWEADGAGGADVARQAFRHDAEPHFRYAVTHLSDGARRALVAAARGIALDPTTFEAQLLVRRGLLVRDGARLRPFSAELGRWVVHDVDTSSPPDERPGASRDDSTVLRARHAGLAVGDVLEDRYELQRKLGHGGFGVVFAARDRLLNRDVAIKVLRVDRGGGGDSQRRRQRLLEEAQAASRISSPHVVAVHDIRQRSEDWFVVMELVPGRSLRELLVEHGTLPAGDALALAMQAADGLAAAHELGVVHRDVKPENLLVTPEGHLKVGDFGLAFVADRGALSSERAQAMTPRYSAPEQVLGESMSPATDVFALACVLYEMLAGRPAFEGESVSTVLYRIVNHAPPPLAGIDDAGEPLAALIRRCLQRDPAARPAGCAELRRALQALRDAGA